MTVESMKRSAAGVPCAASRVVFRAGTHCATPPATSGDAWVRSQREVLLWRVGDITQHGTSMLPAHPDGCRVGRLGVKHCQPDNERNERAGNRAGATLGLFPIYDSRLKAHKGENAQRHRDPEAQRPTRSHSFDESTCRCESMHQIVA